MGIIDGNFRSVCLGNLLIKFINLNLSEKLIFNSNAFEGLNRKLSIRKQAKKKFEIKFFTAKPS